jgi:hypothetical protein
MTRPLHLQFDALAVAKRELSAMRTSWDRSGFVFERFAEVTDFLLLSRHQLRVKHHLMFDHRVTELFRPWVDVDESALSNIVGVHVPVKLDHIL